MKIITEYFQNIPDIEKEQFKELYNLKNKKIICFKSNHKLKAEILAVNYLKKQELPFTIIEVEEKNPSLFLRNILKILHDINITVHRENKNENGNYFYMTTDIEELGKIFPPHIIFLKNMSENLLNIINTLTNCFLKNLKFLITYHNKEIKETDNMKIVEIDNLNLKNIEIFIKNINNKLDEATKKGDFIEYVFLLAHLPFFDTGITSKTLNIEERKSIELQKRIEDELKLIYKTQNDILTEKFFFSFDDYLKSSIFQIYKNIDEKKLSVFFIKAGEIFEKSGFFDHAFSLYKRSENIERIENLLEKNTELLFIDHMVRNWVKSELEDLEISKIEEYPFICAIKGDNFRGKGEFELAENLIKKAIERAENRDLRYYFYIFLFNLYWDKGEDFKILSEFEKIVKEKIPPLAMARLYLIIGSLYILMQKIEEAERYFLDTISILIDKKYFTLMEEASYRLGYIIRNFKTDIERALSLYKRKSNVYLPLSSNIGKLFNLSNTYALVGKFKEAEKILQKLKNLHNFYPEFMNGVYPFMLEGRINLYRKKYNESVKCFEKALKKAKIPYLYFDISIYLSMAYIFLNNIERAGYYMKKSTEKYKPITQAERNTYNVVKAMYLYKKGEIDKSMEIVDNLMKEKYLKNEEKLILMHLKSKILEIKGEKEESKKIKEQLLKVIKKMKTVYYFESL